MNEQHRDVLAVIQALSIAGHKQTGIPTAFSSFTTVADGGLRIHASVTIMPDEGKAWSLRGTTSPHPSPSETALEGLRDRLAEWIAENRKQEAA
jgi:hypothetical protein